MPQLDVFHLDLYEFADPCAGCCQKANYKIPEQLVIPFEAGFEILIVGLADDIFQKGFLLHSHKRHFQALFADALQVGVDCPQTQIDGLWLVVLYQPHLIRSQVLFFVILSYCELYCRMAKRYEDIVFSERFVPLKCLSNSSIIVKDLLSL